MTEVYDRQLDVGIDFGAATTRQALIRWIVESECDHAVTLATNARMPLKRALERVRQWFYRMEKIIRKCRPERLPTEARMFGFIVPEHVGTNVHFHLAVRLVDGRDITAGDLETIYEIAERQWSILQPSGSFKIKPISDANGWARYITKDYYVRGTSLVLSHDFHNSDRFTRWKSIRQNSGWV
jgi:hypothetical protein